MSSAQRQRYKVCILGAPGAGKTALVRRFVDGSFTEGPRPGRGLDFYACPVQLRDDLTVTLQLWDVSDCPAGPSDDPKPLAAYLFNAQACLLVHDVTALDTLATLQHALPAIELVFSASGGALPYLALVGAKCDLPPCPGSDSLAAELAARHGCMRFSASARTGEGVALLLLQLACDLAGVPVTATCQWEQLRAERAAMQSLSTAGWPQQPPCTVTPTYIDTHAAAYAVGDDGRAVGVRTSTGCSSGRGGLLGPAERALADGRHGSSSFAGSASSLHSQRWRPVAVSRASSPSPPPSVISKSNPFGSHKRRVSAAPRASSPSSCSSTTPLACGTASEACASHDQLKAEASRGLSPCAVAVEGAGGQQNVTRGPPAAGGAASDDDAKKRAGWRAFCCCA